MKLFVYGTLKRGYHNHGVIDGATYVGTGCIKGDMLDLGAFPGVVDLDNTDSVVYGEVYEIDDTILRRCDMLEGFHDDDHAGSLYLRKRTTVTMLGRDPTSSYDIDDVITYEYNQAGRAWHKEPSPWIVTGVWTR